MNSNRSGVHCVCMRACLLRACANKNKTHKNQDNRFAQFNWMMLVVSTGTKKMVNSSLLDPYCCALNGLCNTKATKFLGRKKAKNESHP